jgi:hypothetical protein
VTYSDLYDFVWTRPTDMERNDALASLSPARRAAWRIMEDLRDRRGIGDEIDLSDGDVKDEIFAAMEIAITEETK